VVDDDEDDREIYGRILLYNGFDVIFAPSARSALRLARLHAPDLVLLDLGLPDAHGLDMCAEMRREDATRAIPVVVLTAFRERELGQRAREVGCTEFIEKPASPVDVLHTIESLIGKAPLAGVGTPPQVVDDAT
jgi:DNA-binding response OmpR family regulator